MDALAAAGDDATALRDAIRALPADETAHEGGAVARVLQHLAARPLAVCVGVATALALPDEHESPASATKILVGTLQLVRQRLDGEQVDEVALRPMVVAHGKRLARELTTGEVPQDLKTALLWADAVVDVSSRIRDDENLVAAEQQPNEESETPWAVQLAREFFRIHQHSEAHRVDFRIMTLVWKSLNRLCTLHREAILKYSKAVVAPEGFSYTDLFEGAATGLAQTSQRLRLLATNEGDEAFVRELKLLRLFLRAFQGQFVQFVDAMVAQVECGVALAVDSIAAVIPVAEGLKTKSEPVRHDALRVLQCTVTLVETMAKNDKLQASTRSFVGTLLWQPHDKIASLVTQTRSQYVDELQLDDSVADYLQWGHLIAVSSFSTILGVGECSNFSSESAATVVKDTSGFAMVARLFKRFRECVRRGLLQDFTTSTSLFVDITLDSLVALAQPVGTMQLFLLEHTLHPDPSQRLLLWELWREFMCFIWEDQVAHTCFSALLKLSYSKNQNGVALDAVVREEIMGLLAYLYPEMALTAKQECLHFVASAFDSVCAEGPTHKYTAKMAAALDLLDKLSISLLAEYEDPKKEEWIADYLPVALQCVGGVLDSLDHGDASLAAEQLGFVRMLDTALLIIRPIFEDSDDTEIQGANGLSGMLLPMCTETVTQLAKLSEGGDKRTSATTSKSFSRALTSCLYLITKLASSIKVNHGNQCAQLIKDLLSILLSQHELSPHSLAIAIFVRDALGDVWVAGTDADAVWKMLGQLFHKLSALHFGLQVDPVTQPLTPSQSVCLNAFYTLLAQSNLPDFADSKKNFKSWMVPHAQARFASYLQGMCESHLPQSNLFSGVIDKFDENNAKRLSLPWTLDTAEVATKKRDRDRSLELSSRGTSSTPVNGTDDVDVEEEIENAKRIKWDEFAATYWQLHDSLSSLSSPRQQQAFIDGLSENDLDQATTALRNLLRNNPIKK